MDGWVGGWMDGWMDGWMVGWMDGWMGGWMGGWMDGWTDGGTVGRMDGWIIGWMMDNGKVGYPIGSPGMAGIRSAFVQALGGGTAKPERKQPATEAEVPIHPEPDAASVFPPAVPSTRLFRFLDAN
eukprot:359867-Chlamydomonas_euryale.AAC.1